MAVLGVSGIHLTLDGQVINEGTAAEGLALNARLVQAIADFRDQMSSFDPEANTDAFIAALDSYRAHGLNAITINLQGGLANRNWGESYNNSAWNADGSLKSAYASRLTRVLNAMTARGIIPFVGLFYFRQDQVVNNQPLTSSFASSSGAVKAAVDNAISFLQPWKNQIVVEVINESDHRLVNQPWLQTANVGQVIAYVKAAGYLASASRVPGQIPPSNWNPSIVFLHGNNRTTADISQMVQSARSRFGNRPIAFNEDGASGNNDQYTAAEYVAHLGAAVSAGAGWGYYDQPTYQDAKAPTIDWSIRSSGSSRAVFDRFAELSEADGTAPPPPSGETTWVEAGRKVVFEVESAAPVGDWVFEDDDAGHTGTGYFTQRGSTALNNPGQSIIRYRVKITNSGPYYIALHTRRQGSGAADADNDCFIRLDGGTWHKHFQRAGQPSTDGGSGSHEAWRWADRVEIGGSNVDPVFQLSAGYHTFEISKRSANYSIDRVHMFSLSSGTPTMADNPPLSEPVSQIESGGGGGGEEPPPAPTVVPPSVSTVLHQPTAASTVQITRDQSTSHLLVTAMYDLAGANRIAGGASVDGYVDVGPTDSVSTPDHPSLDAITRVAIITMVQPASWLPAATQSLVSKWDPPAGRSYALQLDTGLQGRFRFMFDQGLGGGVEIINSKPHNLTGSSLRWVQVVFVGDNGSGQHTCHFFVSSDGINWVGLGGHPDGAAGTKSIQATSTPVLLGNDLGAGGEYEGRIYGASILTEGVLAADPNFRTAVQEQGDGTFVDSTGKVWTLSSGATRVAPQGTGGMFWQGVPLTRIQGASRVESSIEQWYLANPIQGSGVLEIQFASTPSKLLVVSRQVSASQGRRASSTAVGSSPTPTVAVSAVAGSLVIADHLADDGAAFPSSPPSGWTETWDARTGTTSADIAGAGGHRTTDVDGVRTWAPTIPSASWQAAAIEFTGTPGTVVALSGVAAAASAAIATGVIVGAVSQSVYTATYGPVYPTAFGGHAAAASAGFGTLFVSAGFGGVSAAAADAFGDLTVTGAIVVVPVPRPATYSLTVVARQPRSASEPQFTEVGPLTGWSGLAWEEALSDEAGASVTVDPHAQPDSVRNRLADLVDASELWVYRGDVVVFAGPIIQIEPRAAEAGIVTTLHARSLWHYPRRWWIEPADTLTYSGVDQFEIVRSLIGYYQNLAHGNVGIDVVSGLSGVNRDRTYVGSENHNIGQRIEELAAVIDGFEFRIDPATRQLNLGFPTLGVDRTGTVILDRRNIADPGAVMSVGPDDLASEGYGVSPQDDPSPPLVSHRSTVGVRQRFGRFGHFAAYQDISNQATLDGHTDHQLEDRDEMFYQPAPELIPVAGADVDDFTVGDTIEMAYDYGFSTLVTHRRVTRRRISVSETGDETISVEFDRGGQTAVKKIRSLERRISQLEARR